MNFIINYYVCFDSNLFKMKHVCQVIFFLLISQFTFSQTIDAVQYTINKAASSNPMVMGELFDKMVVSAQDSRDKRSPWLYDPVSGEREAIKRFEGAGGISFEGLQIGNRIFFVGSEDIPDEPRTGLELWVTDGTEAGTYLVKDIRPGRESSSIKHMTNYNGILIFKANDGVHGDELWRSDGTEAGTYMIKDMNPGSSNSQFYNIYVFKDHVYFANRTFEHGLEIWKSDGTEEGTQVLKDIKPGSSSGVHSHEMVLFGDYMYFLAQEDSSNYYWDLWRSDGTTEGTERLYRSQANWGSAANFEGTAAENYFVFNTTQGVWKSDGTVSGTVQLSSTKGEGFYAHGNSVFYSARPGEFAMPLWITDGTPNGTREVKDIYPGRESENQGYYSYGDRIYFRATNVPNESGLWTSDGTEAGTYRINENLKIFRHGYNMAQFHEKNGKLYFSAEGDYLHGTELWELDPVTHDVRMAEDFNLSASSEITNRSRFMQSVGRRTVLLAFDGSQKEVLYGTDGTPEVTERLLEASFKFDYGVKGEHLFVKNNGNLYFTAKREEDGYELYKTNGTAAGTKMMKRFIPATNTFDRPWMASYNDILYFNADDGINGYQMWRTDGTEEGTYLFKKTSPYGHGFAYNRGGSVVFNNKLYFSAFNGEFHQLYMSDGTPEGTVPILDFTEKTDEYTGIDILGAKDDVIFFFKGDQNQNNYYGDLYVTNGNHMNSTKIAENIERQGLMLNSVIDGFLYFGMGRELHRTDGTEEGTVSLGYIADRRLKDVFKCGDYVYTAWMDGTPIYFWVTDGTPEGTVEIDQYVFENGYICAKNTVLFPKATSIGTENGIGYFQEDFSVAVAHFNSTNGDTLHDTTMTPQHFNIDTNTFFFNAQSELGGRELYSTNAMNPVLNIPDHSSESQNIAIDIQVYPNPNEDGFLYIHAKNEIIRSFSIYDISGKELSRRTGHSEMETVDIRNLSQGFYLVKIDLGHSTITKKVIKK